MALFAAVGTIFLLHRQVAQAAELATDQRERRKRAARATLHAALSSLTTYAEQCAAILLPLIPPGESEQGVTAPPDGIPEIPEIAPEIISVLRECIEFSDSGPADSLTELVSKLQVQRDRLLGTRADLLGESPTATSAVITTMNIDQYAIDTMEICARAEMLFEYARHESEEVPLDVGIQSMSSAARRFNIRDHSHPRIHRILQRRFTTPD